MGHLVGKDLYRKLGRKLDGLEVCLPWNEELYSLLREIYSEDDARLIIAMPSTLKTLDELAQIMRRPSADLERPLADLCSRGLVVDLTIKGKVYYAITPYIIGFFETVWMHRGDFDRKKLARLFQKYTVPYFWPANWGAGQKMTTFRVLPSEGTLAEDYVEVLDYEKAGAIIEQNDYFALGTCSCRHELEHEGERACSRGSSLELCAIIGATGQSMVRNGLAREISRAEMLEHLARARDMGLVFNADNVQHGVRFICSCCSCCCNVLRGVRRGYQNSIVSSNYIARINTDACNSCKRCSQLCPVAAIQSDIAEPSIDARPMQLRRGRMAVMESRCFGCGVCATKCSVGAIKLYPRQQRVFTPDTIFERVILQTLERGNLQNVLFDRPSVSHLFLRGFVGGFLKIPTVKRALVSEQLRSRFLAVMKDHAPECFR